MAAWLPSLLGAGAPSVESLKNGPLPGVAWSAGSLGAQLHGPAAEVVQRALVGWFVPALGERYWDAAARPSASWPGASLGEALAILAAYVVLLAVGVSRARAHAGPLVSDAALKPLMLAYNGGQVLLSAWLAGSAAWQSLALPRLRFACNAFDLGAGPAMPAVVWLFMLSKVVDFMDTVLIVARGKWAQLSFLHCYHHATIFAMFWLTVAGAAQGDVFFPVLINSIVHTLMYLYYLLAALGARPSWGRYLTQFQMVQFVGMTSQALLILGFGCLYPARMSYLYLAYAFSLLFLFAWFYVDKHLRVGRAGAGEAGAPAKARGGARVEKNKAA